MSSAALLNQPATYMATDGGASQFVSPFPPPHFGLGTHQYFANRGLRGDIPPFFVHNHPSYSAPLEFSGYAPGHYGNVPFSESKLVSFFLHTKLAFPFCLFVSKLLHPPLLVDGTVVRFSAT